MSCQLFGYFDWSSGGLEIVNGDHIVESSASDEIARGGVGTSHYPGGTQGDGMELVGGVGVPDDELSVL